MLSFTKTFTSFPSHHHLPRASKHHLSHSLAVIRSSSDDGNDSSTSQPTPPTITPPDAVEIRFKRGSRRRRKQQEEEGGVAAAAQKKVVKDWDSMTLTEKALELYVGEKGVLFWLNKFAYASIFIVIGGWILFRFVGPSLNLYQLDTPPLAPTSMFKG